MDAILSTIPCKVRWDVFQGTVYSTYMNIFWYFCCTSPFIFVLITIKKIYFYHIVYAYVVSFIISIETRFIMAIFNSLISKFVRSIEFFNEIHSSTLTCFHCCCEFVNVFRMKRMMRTGALLYSFENTHIILVFVQTTVSIEVKQWMKLTL